MSTPQSDSHWDNQHRIFIEFDALIQRWFDGKVDYDEVEETLADLEEDPDVEEYTYRKCEEIWTEAKKEESFWQDEDRKMWEQLEADSGEAY